MATTGVLGVCTMACSSGPALWNTLGFRGLGSRVKMRIVEIRTSREKVPEDLKQTHPNSRRTGKLEEKPFG